MTLRAALSPASKSLFRSGSALGPEPKVQSSSARVTHPKESGSTTGLQTHKAPELQTGTTCSSLADQPVTGLSLAYDVHVRRSKSSLALSTASKARQGSKAIAPLSTSQSGSAQGTLARPGFSKVNSLGYEYRRTGRPAPPAPNPASALHLDLLQRRPAQSSLRIASPASCSKPLPTPPVGLPRCHSSTLLRPTASSLARMQATVQPPSLASATPNSSTAKFHQRTPFKSNMAGTLAPIPPLPLPSPCKKLMVPKSPHRRAMEKHIMAGRSSGMPSATGGFKSRTSHASLAMGQKQREIEERRRERSRPDMPIF